MSEPKDPGIPQQPPTPDQANRDIIDFESFNIRDLDWKASEDGKKFTAHRYLKTGEDITRFAGTISIKKGKDILEEIDLRLEFGRDPFLRITAKIDRNGKCQDTMLRRRKFDSLHNLVAGQDHVFYQKFLKFLDARARIEKQIRIHEIDRMVSFVGRYDEKTWNTKFVPVLRAAGYREISPNKWEKQFEVNQ